jgi:histidine triad (HIT) family protein
MSECIFCKIVAGDIPAEKVYEDEHTLAFLDLHPSNPGHTLVVPKEHSRNVLDSHPNALAHMIHTAQKISVALKSIGAEGVNIISNNEIAAGQVIFHAHLHIIPRYADDGLALWHGKPYAEGEMERSGEKIRNALA